MPVTKLLFGAFALYLGAMAFRPDPFYCDVYAYQAIALEHLGRDSTYARITQLIPPEIKEFLAPLQWADAKSFAEHLPFYRIRWGYNLALSGAIALGVPVAYAPQTLSALSMAASMVPCFLLCPSVLTLLLFVALGGVELAEIPGPQPLAFLCLCWLMYLPARFSWLSFPMLSFRPDWGVWAGFLLIARRQWLVLGVCVLLALAPAAYFGAPGWRVLSYHSHVVNLAYPLSEPKQISLQGYVQAAVKQVRIAVYTRTPFFFAILLGFVGVASRRSRCLLMSMALFFVLFPSAQPRFLFPGMFLVALLGVTKMTQVDISRCMWHVYK